jgi:hypothetical protein
MLLRVRGRETETAPTGTSFHKLLRVASVATDRESERASKFTRVPSSAARLNFGTQLIRRHFGAALETRQPL